MRVAVIDNDRALLRSLEILLGAEGHDVCCFSEPDLAVETLGALPRDAWPDLLLVDYMMPCITGIELLRAVKRSRPSTCTCVVITAHSGKFSTSDLDGLGVKAVLDKPLDLGRLMAVVSGGLGADAPLPGHVSAVEPTDGEDEHASS